MFDPKRKTSVVFKSISCLQIFALLIFFVLPSQLVYAQTATVLNLPLPGTMVTTSEKFVPPLVKGLTLHPENPLAFDFIIDPGNAQLNQDQLKAESEKLVKYFLASLTIPEEDLWVNLSPYEKSRIIPEGLGQTEMGRDLLGQDYILKQLSASLIYPEKDLGKDFWNRVYEKAKAVYGTTDIPVNTFNKVWIVPEKATILETDTTAFVVKSRLKVMLEEDYVALDHNRADAVLGTDHLENKDVNQVSSISSGIVREIILPEIEKEVNEGKNFASLRQIYNSLILAVWFKHNLKDNLINQIYSDQLKVTGVDVADKDIKEKIYQQYLQAYRKGVFNYIKEDADAATGEAIPRKYFSGGAAWQNVNADIENQKLKVDQTHTVQSFIDSKAIASNDLQTVVPTETFQRVTWTVGNHRPELSDIQRNNDTGDAADTAMLADHMHQLSSQDEAKVIEAIKALAKEGSARAIPDLNALIRSRGFNDSIAKEAQSAIQKIRTDLNHRKQIFADNYEKFRAAAALPANIPSKVFDYETVKNALSQDTLDSSKIDELKQMFEKLNLPTDYSSVEVRPLTLEGEETKNQLEKLTDFSLRKLATNLSSDIPEGLFFFAFQAFPPQEAHRIIQIVEGPATSNLTQVVVSPTAYDNRKPLSVATVTGRMQLARQNVDALKVIPNFVKILDPDVDKAEFDKLGPAKNMNGEQRFEQYVLSSLGQDKNRSFNAGYAIGEDHNAFFGEKGGKLKVDMVRNNMQDIELDELIYYVDHDGYTDFMDFFINRLPGYFPPNVVDDFNELKNIPQGQRKDYIKKRIGRIVDPAVKTKEVFHLANFDTLARSWHTKQKIRGMGYRNFNLKDVVTSRSEADNLDKIKEPKYIGLFREFTQQWETKKGWSDTAVEIVPNLGSAQDIAAKNIRNLFRGVFKHGYPLESDIMLTMSLSNFNTMVSNDDMLPILRYQLKPEGPGQISSYPKPLEVLIASSGNKEALKNAQGDLRNWLNRNLEANTKVISVSDRIDFDSGRSVVTITLDQNGTEKVVTAEYQAVYGFSDTAKLPRLEKVEYRLQSPDANLTSRVETSIDNYLEELKQPDENFQRTVEQSLEKLNISLGEVRIINVGDNGFTADKAMLSDYENSRNEFINRFGQSSLIDWNDKSLAQSIVGTFVTDDFANIDWNNRGANEKERLTDLNVILDKLQEKGIIVRVSQNKSVLLRHVDRLQGPERDELNSAIGKEAADKFLAVLPQSLSEANKFLNPAFGYTLSSRWQSDPRYQETARAFPLIDNHAATNALSPVIDSNGQVVSAGMRDTTEKLLNTFVKNPMLSADAVDYTYKGIMGKVLADNLAGNDEGAFDQKLAALNKEQVIPESLRGLNVREFLKALNSPTEAQQNDVRSLLEIKQNADQVLRDLDQLRKSNLFSINAQGEFENPQAVNTIKTHAADMFRLNSLMAFLYGLVNSVGPEQLQAQNSSSPNGSVRDHAMLTNEDNVFAEDDLGTTGDAIREQTARAKEQRIPEAMRNNTSFVQQDEKKYGGIDLNPANLKIEINKENGGVNVQYDPKLIEQIRQQGIDGFVPFIINMQPMTSVMPLLGASSPEEKPLQLTSLN